MNGPPGAVVRGPTAQRTGACVAVGLAGLVALMAGLASTVGLGRAAWGAALGCAVVLAALVVRGLADDGHDDLGPADAVTLGRALLGCAVAFTPLMLGLTFGAPVARALARAARLVASRHLPWQSGIIVDWVAQDPEPSAAVIQGLFFGRTAPPREERRTFDAPTLVIGGAHDPATPPEEHAKKIAQGIPGARLEILDGAHLINVEQSDEVVRLLLEHF